MHETRGAALPCSTPRTASPLFVRRSVAMQPTAWLPSSSAVAPTHPRTCWSTRCAGFGSVTAGAQNHAQRHLVAQPRRRDRHSARDLSARQTEGSRRVPRFCRGRYPPLHQGPAGSPDELLAYFGMRMMRRAFPLKSLSLVFRSGMRRRMIPIVRAPMQLGPRPIRSLQSLP